jgi:hypothetical protein
MEIGRGDIHGNLTEVKCQGDDVTVPLTVFRATLRSVNGLGYVINFCSFVSDVIYVGRPGGMCKHLGEYSGGYGLVKVDAVIGY